MYNYWVLKAKWAFFKEQKGDEVGRLASLMPSLRY